MLDDWKKATIVLLYKDKGSRSGVIVVAIGDKLFECARKVYRRILTERLIEVTERKVSEVQEEFRKGRGCVDQIFAMKMLIGGVLGKR